jgi:hypothetical protein
VLLQSISYRHVLEVWCVVKIDIPSRPIIVWDGNCRSWFCWQPRSSKCPHIACIQMWKGVWLGTWSKCEYRRPTIIDPNLIYPQCIL